MTHSEEIVVPCDSNCLQTIREFVRKRSTEAGLSSKDVGRLVLAADEASSNIIRHSYHFDWLHQIAILCHLNPDHVVVEIRDDSPVPYLPSLADDFDLPTKLKYRHASGYGKYLMRHAVDDVQYETIPGSYNCVRLVKFLHPLRNREKKKETSFAELLQTRSLSLKMLFDVLGELDRYQDSEKMTKLLLYAVMGRLSTQPVVVLRATDGGDFEILGQVGLSKKVVLEGLKLMRHGCLVETLWSHRGPFLSEEFKKLQTPTAEIEILERLRSVVLVPIFIANQLRGILSLGGKRNRQPFTEEDVSLVTLLTSHVLLLLKNLNEPLFQRERQASSVGLREAVRGAVATLIEASERHKVTFILQNDAPLIPPLNIAQTLLQSIILTLLTHILYLSQEGTTIGVQISIGDGCGSVKIDYQGSSIGLQKSHSVMEQILAGHLRLSDCRKIIVSQGGRVVIKEKENNWVNVVLELPFVKGK